MKPEDLVEKLLDESPAPVGESITIRYEHPRTGEIKEKTFPSEEAMEKWANKHEVKVVSYSKDPTD
jgi:hypothetical protein